MPSRPSIRQRIAGSTLVNEACAAVLTGYIRLCHVTTRWDSDGFEEIEEHLRAGTPVIVILWHERLFMSPYLFNRRLGRLCAITTTSRIATLGGMMLRRFGIGTIMIDPKASSLGSTREVIGRIRDGYSIAISPDGTRGPAREAKSFPIKWARVAKVPVFCVSYSVRRGFRLPTWDKAIIPLPFNRGALLASRWDAPEGRQMSEAELQRHCWQLSDAICDVTDEADRRCGRVRIAVRAARRRQRSGQMVQAED